MKSKWILRVKVSDNDNELVELYKKQIEKHMDMIKNNKYPDSGFDVFCPSNWNEKKTKLVNTNIQCSLYKKVTYDCGVSEVPSAYYMYARSSIYKTSYRLANNVGIIDSGYRGVLKAAMDPKRSNVENEEFVPLEKGKRYWQLCTPTLEPFDEVLLVSDLGETVRGSGGHGSTGL
jgi:dUTP pyrophosphatase